MPSGGFDGKVAALNVGSDYNGQYIQFSPADQRSFLSGGSTLLLGSLGLLMGPLGALLLGSLGPTLAGTSSSLPAQTRASCFGTSTCLMMMRMDAVTGTATSAPSRPSSVPPARAPITTSEPGTETALFITRGVIT